jgi:hypothetical protein
VINGRAFGLLKTFDRMKSDPDLELALFTEALRMPRQERDEFLDRKCQGDKELRKRLERLLSAHERAGNFLEEPPTDCLSE